MDGKKMKKPKIKKRKNYYLVYWEKTKAFTCFDLAGAKLYYNLLLLEKQRAK
jgi:hypothetical protein